MKKYLSTLTLFLFGIFLIIQFVVPVLTKMTANDIRHYNDGLIYRITEPFRIPVFGLLSKEMRAHTDTLGQLPDNKILRTSVSIISLFIYSLIIAWIIKFARKSVTPKRRHALLLLISAIGATLCSYQALKISIFASTSGSSRDFGMFFTSLAFLLAFTFISLLISLVTLSFKKRLFQSKGFLDASHRSTWYS